jgi:hypothetical protein
MFLAVWVEIFRDSHFGAKMMSSTPVAVGDCSEHMFNSQKVSLLKAAVLSTALIAACTATMAGEGIWKAAVPRPGTMKGEFDNNDPIGLYAGVKIKADCSLNWTNPDDHKLYCFSSATSLVFFLDAPAQYLESARASWRKLQATKG